MRSSRVLTNGLRVVPLIPSLIFLGVLLLAPVFQLLVLSFIGSDGFSLENYLRIFSTTLYLQILWTTFKIALVACGVCLVAGYPLAYLLSTSRPAARNALLIWVLIPLWTSFLVRAISWMIILGRNGVLNQTSESLGIGPIPFRMIYNFTGVIIGTVHGLLPMAVLTMFAVMQNIDPNLSKAAGTLGARPSEAFWRIYFPLSAPGVAGAGLLVFIAALGYFVAPQLLGGPSDMMIAPLIILQLEQGLNMGFAGALSLLLLVSTLLALYLFHKAIGLSSLMGEAPASQSARSPNGRLLSSGAAQAINLIGRVASTFAASVQKVFGTQSTGKRPFLWAVSLSVVLFLAAPALFLIPTSFTEAEFLSWPPKGFTLEWYSYYFNSPVWQAATWRSILVAIASASLSMALGVPAALVLTRQSVPFRPLVIAIVLLPIVLPEMIVAVPLFSLFSKIGLVGTNTGLVLGHTVFGLPYVVVTLMAVLRNYDARLDHAAWTLGANRFTAFRLVTLPIILPGVITAFLFAFIKSFDELTVALFIAGGTMTTLPRELWASAQQKVDPSLAAVASIMLGIIIVVLGLGRVFERRMKTPSRTK